MLHMKRIEIIIPHERLADAHNVLKDANVGGISHYRILLDTPHSKMDTSGKVK
jgi:hypothetical protein